MKKNEEFKPISGPVFLTSDDASKELDKLIEYCVLVVKLKDEEDPRSFSLSNLPDVRNLILSFLV